MIGTTSLVVSATWVILAMGMAAPATAQAVDPGVAVVCGSNAGERQTCAADTAKGVTLVRSTGTVACVLGSTWGIDEKSIWVRDGCSAEFSLGTQAAQPAGGQGFGTYTPGRGFKVAQTPSGELNIRLFGYARYLNQRALDETAGGVHIGALSRRWSRSRVPLHPRGELLRVAWATFRAARA
jgi:hypothetical protein